MVSQKEDFLKYQAATSPYPRLLEVERAEVAISTPLTASGISTLWQGYRPVHSGIATLRWYAQFRSSVRAICT